MNPLSSFSFGTIIKTFIPGLIAAGAPLLLGELIYRLSLDTGCDGDGLWRCFFAGSFIWSSVLVDGARAAAFGAALVPLSLTLGFFINTLLWLCVNDLCRCWSDGQLDPRLRRQREQLKQRALARLARAPGGSPRVHHVDFFLPLVDFQKFTHLRESYFSWFEFQLNSAAALLLTMVSYAVTVIWLATAWSLRIHYLTHLALPLLLAAGGIVLLVIAGLRNLLRYEEGLIWFLTGTLAAPPAARARRGPAT